MKKKVWIIIGIVVVVVAAAALLLPRLFGGSHRGIDNEPEARRCRGEQNSCRLLFVVGQRAANGTVDRGGNGRRAVPYRPGGILR